MKKIVILLFLIPSITFAFPGDLSGVIGIVIGITDILVPILTSLSFLVFGYGVAKFILSAGDSKAVKDGRDFMIYGILALFVLVSYWGIIQFLSDQFEFGQVKGPLLPTGGAD